MSKDIGDLVSIIINSTIRLCRNNPDLEFAALASAAAFAAISSEATEDDAVEYFREAFRMATLGKEMAIAGGMQ
jgi:hypothetical protein